MSNYRCLLCGRVTHLFLYSWLRQVYFKHNQQHYKVKHHSHSSHAAENADCQTQAENFKAFFISNPSLKAAEHPQRLGKGLPGKLREECAMSVVLRDMVHWWAWQC